MGTRWNASLPILSSVLVRENLRNSRQLPFLNRVHRRLSCSLRMAGTASSKSADTNCANCRELPGGDPPVLVRDDSRDWRQPVRGETLAEHRRSRTAATEFGAFRGHRSTLEHTEDAEEENSPVHLRRAAIVCGSSEPTGFQGVMSRTEGKKLRTRRGSRVKSGRCAT